MDILFFGLGDLFAIKLKDNLTGSTVWNTGETGDMNVTDGSDRSPSVPISVLLPSVVDKDQGLGKCASGRCPFIPLNEYPSSKIIISSL